MEDGRFDQHTENDQGARNVSQQDLDTSSFSARIVTSQFVIPMLYKENAGGKYGRDHGPKLNDYSARLRYHLREELSIPSASHIEGIRINSKHYHGTVHVFCWVDRAKEREELQTGNAAEQKCYGENDDFLLNNSEWVLQLNVSSDG
jgi:hypothetical protein